MSDKLKTIDFGNFKLDVTEEQFENIDNGFGVDYDEEDGLYKVYDQVLEISEYIEEEIVLVTEGGIWNQPGYFERGDGSYYEFEFSKPTEGNGNLEIFDFYNESKWGGLYLKDNSTRKFLKPSESPEFDSLDDFDGYYQMNSNEIYLLKDFDIKNYLDI